MENATKALLMAGGILLSLLIIGALYLMLSNLSSYKDENDASKKTSQIAEFNNQFEPYIKDNLTLMELKSIYNKLESNNKNTNYKINHNINTDLLDYVDANGTRTRDTEDIISDKFMTDDGFRKIPEAQKINRRFKCVNVKYENENGRISYMKFEDVTPNVTKWKKH